LKLLQDFNKIKSKISAQPVKEVMPASSSVANPQSSEVDPLIIHTIENKTTTTKSMFFESGPGSIDNQHVLIRIDREVEYNEQLITSRG
jgi:hypothetical protein